MLGLYRRYLGEDAKEILGSLRNLAHVPVKWGKFTTACEIKKDLVSTHTRIHGDMHDYTIGAMNGYGIFLTLVGRYKEAESKLDDLYQKKA